MPITFFNGFSLKFFVLPLSFWKNITFILLVQSPFDTMLKIKIFNFNPLSLYTVSDIEFLCNLYSTSTLIFQLQKFFYKLLLYNKLYSPSQVHWSLNCVNIRKTSTSFVAAFRHLYKSNLGENNIFIFSLNYRSQEQHHTINANSLKSSKLFINH